ncbi:SMI1/KNR4 family protein [Piscinibacter gummiphilus]|uniref:SMI1/KNR4 family protein n=1 Tax=Piscinibacter gummiphilus TaxID=946333 RepID=A0ABZ0CVA4_9BURK|nr:SMI1/KNR4 family protein [Piscinibacter gummiphilus]WOB06900.1 SMI1/KNR4 family protein [Piscinibacter gummiphilus]
MSDLSEKLQSLQMEMPGWCIAPTEELVLGYEKQFGLTLPPDYRAFLAEFGGCLVNASAPFQEPTPFGRNGIVDHFFGFMPEARSCCDVRANTARIEGAPDVVAIAGDLMGGMIWLKCTGIDTGNVYYYDHEQRASWPDERFNAHFSALSSDIENYLALRRQNQLPQKTAGYANLYRMAATFSGFVSSLERDA